MENGEYENSRYNELQDFILYGLPDRLLSGTHVLHYAEQKPVTDKERFLVRLQSYLIAIGTYKLAIKETGQKCG